MKLLYLFSGIRKGKFVGKPGVDFPDTQFYGLNHFEKLGINASTIEWADVVKIPIVKRLFGFRLRHLALFFVTQRYDLVFGSSLLYMMVLKKIFRPKTKYILFNLGINRAVTTHKNHWFRLRLIKWLLSSFSGIVCLSSTQLRHLQNIFPKIKERLFFVPLGVDTNFYQPAFAGRSDLIISVGRDNGRDYKTLVEAAKLLPNRQFEIICSERNLVGIDNIPNNVKVTFDLPFNELKKKYQTAQLLVLSTHDDNWLDGSDCSGQTVLLDAMANGLPVIASKKAYLADYVINNSEIKMVDCYAPEQLATMIQEMEDASVRDFIARNARAKVEKEFSTGRMAENLAGIFNLIFV